jgi:hypothetical protein
MSEDDRVTAARDLLATYEREGNRLKGQRVLRDLLAYSEERLRVNVGLVMENKELRQRVHELEEGPSEVAAS